MHHTTIDVSYLHYEDDFFGVVVMKVIINLPILDTSANKRLKCLSSQSSSIASIVLSTIFYTHCLLSSQHLLLCIHHWVFLWMGAQKDLLPLPRTYIIPSILFSFFFLIVSQCIASYLSQSTTDTNPHWQLGIHQRGLVTFNISFPLFCTDTSYQYQHVSILSPYVGPYHIF